MKQSFIITGISCEACVAYLNKTLLNISGINEVNINIVNGQTNIQYDESIVSFDQIKLAIEQSGYGVNNKESRKDYSLSKLIVSAILLVLLMDFTMGHMIHLPLSSYIYQNINPILYVSIQFILVIPIIIIYSSYYKRGIENLIKLHPNMDSLIAVGSIASLVYGFYALINVYLGNIEYLHNLYIESSAMILTFVSIGKYLEQRSKVKTSKAIESLINLIPEKATLLDGRECKIDELKVNDIIVVKKGELIPSDGIIVKGNGEVNEATLTGEATPNFKDLNSLVYSSTYLQDGYLEIKVLKETSDTSIAKIIELVKEASISKAKISKLVDKIALYFVPCVILISLITFIVNLLITKNFEISFNYGISVLVIACPCSLGLATPVAIMVSSGVAFKNGILVKNAAIFEKVKDIDTVCFDKTGTITKGILKVEHFKSFKEEVKVLEIIYSLEKLSEHPISKEIVKYCKAKYLEYYDVENFESLIGYGLKGTINNNVYYVVNDRFIKDNKINIINEYLFNNNLDINLNLYLVFNNNIIGVISLSDEIKESSLSSIQELNNKGIKTVLITGDNQVQALKIANVCKINEVYYEVSPKNKVDIIRKLQDNNHNVLMCGDGVNDAAALEYATLGVAMGTASDITLDSSDIILTNSDLKDVINVINLSKLTFRIIKENLFWAFFYNVCGIILATGLFSSLGIKLNPMIASLCMSMSSVFVVLNALRINNFKSINYHKLSKISYNIQGMMCKHCVNKVYNAAISTPGIKKCIVSLKKNKTILYVNELFNEQLFVKNIQKAGYEVNL